MKNYFLGLITFLILDFFWLAVVARNFYQKYLGHLMSVKVDFIPVIIFYPLYILGLLFFVINPAIKNNSSWLQLILVAGFFGLIAYATYDLTNQATLKNWPLVVTVVDICWGISAAIIVACVVFYFSK